MTKKSEKKVKQAKAGGQDSYLRFRVPGTLKEATEDLCTRRSVKMSQLFRHLLDALIRADEAGDPLIAPFTLASDPKSKAKKPR